jgi:UDP-glucose 4-epimerase
MEIVARELGNITINNIDTRDKYGSVYEDIPRRVPDIDKAMKLLDFNPKTEVEAGIKYFIEWAKINPWWWNN